MQNKPSNEVILSENQWLETERLLLRPVSLDDAQDMFIYASDKHTVRYVFAQHESIHETKEAIASYFISNPLGKYALELKTSKKMIGTVELKVEKEHNRAALGYVLNRKYWGSGYVPEAVTALLRLGFEKIKLMRIYAVHEIDNPNSGRVMVKVGMKLEGKIPNARMLKGKAVTDHLMGMTKEDWQNKIKNK